MLVVTCVSLLPSSLGTRLGDMECCVPSELDFEAADSSVVCYHLSNYSLQRHRVAVNMTWTLFRG